MTKKKSKAEQAQKPKAEAQKIEKVEKVEKKVEPKVPLPESLEEQIEKVNAGLEKMHSIKDHYLKILNELDDLCGKTLKLQFDDMNDVVKNELKFSRSKEQILKELSEDATFKRLLGEMESLEAQKKKFEDIQKVCPPEFVAVKYSKEINAMFDELIDWDDSMIGFLYSKKHLT